MAHSEETMGTWNHKRSTAGQEYLVEFPFESKHIPRPYRSPPPNMNLKHSHPKCFCSQAMAKLMKSYHYWSYEVAEAYVQNEPPTSTYSKRNQSRKDCDCC